LKGQKISMKFRPLFLFVLVLSLLPLAGCKPKPEALMAAVRADNTADVAQLIKKGADANSRTSPNGWSALHYAARNGNVEVVQQLLSAGADPNYAGVMDGQANSAAALKPVVLAQVSMDLLTQIPPTQIEEKLHENGLDDPALVKSLKDPNAADRYQKVIEILGPVTKQ
jgi:ankyrin repeat protein